MSSFRKKLGLCLLAVHAMVPALAQTHGDHLTLGVGALYDKGFDVTVAYEHETSYHSAWEYWGNYYLQYAEDSDAGHVTKNSFFKNYRTWELGAAYKPCVSRGRNHHGNLRIGAGAGSDLSRFIAGAHLGYEHSYALYHGWEFFFQVKADVMMHCDDRFRTGVALGLKIPLY